jgi:hypothetical protein
MALPIPEALKSSIGNKIILVIKLRMLEANAGNPVIRAEGLTPHF